MPENHCTTYGKPDGDPINPISNRTEELVKTFNKGGTRIAVRIVNARAFSILLLHKQERKWRKI